MSVIDPKIVDEVAKELEINDIAKASIRQIGALVRTIEERLGVEYIHFEMGIPVNL